MLIASLFINSPSVTENGFPRKDEHKMSIDEAIKDHDRVQYYSGYVNAMLDALTEDSVDVRSYFAWSEYLPKMLLLCI